MYICIIKCIAHDAIYEYTYLMISINDYRSVFMLPNLLAEIYYLIFFKEIFVLNLQIKLYFK